MNDDTNITSEHDAFARRLAEQLRPPVQLDPGFEMRVMAEVYSVANEMKEQAQAHSHKAHSHKADSQPRLPWWRRRYSLALTPVGIAASIVAVAVLSTLAVTSLTRSEEPLSQTASALAPSEMQTADTVYVMRFMFASDAARSVSVVGDFNGWAKQATPLVQTGQNGLWVTQISLPPGRYEYAFIVDGEEWVPDPWAERRVDDFETESSIVILGPRIS